MKLHTINFVKYECDPDFGKYQRHVRQNIANKGLKSAIGWQTAVRNQNLESMGYVKVRDDGTRQWWEGPA